MKKGITYGWQAILVAVLLVILLGSIQAEAQKKIVFSTPIRTATMYVVPGAAGEEKRFWKQMGLNVEWVSFGSGRAQMDAVAAGAVNVGGTMPVGTIQWTASGLPVVIVANMKQRINFYVYVNSNSRIRKPQDLKGAKIGVPRLGSVGHAYSQVLGRNLGLEDIRVVGTGGVRAAIAALRKGAIDAFIISSFVMVRLKHKGLVRDVASIRDYLPEKWVDNVFFSRRDFAAQRPDDLRKVIKGYKLATKFVMSNPDWAVETLKTRLRYSEGAARAAIRLLRWGDDWTIDPQALRNVRDFMVKYGIIKKKPKLDTLYTNEFVS